MNLCRWPPSTTNLDQQCSYILLTFGDPLPRGEWFRRFEKMLDKFKHEMNWQYYVPDNIFEYYGACFISDDRTIFEEELDNIRQIERCEVLPFSDIRVIDFGGMEHIGSIRKLGSDGCEMDESESEDSMSNNVVDVDTFFCDFHSRLKDVLLVMIYRGYPIIYHRFVELCGDLNYPALAKEQYSDIVKQLQGVVGLHRYDDSLDTLKRSAWTKKDFDLISSDMTSLENVVGCWRKLSKHEKIKLYQTHKSNAPLQLKGDHYHEILEVYKRDWFMDDIFVDKSSNRTWRSELEWIAFERFMNWVDETDEGWEWYVRDWRKKSNIDYRDTTSYAEPYNPYLGRGDDYSSDLEIEKDPSYVIGDRCVDTDEDVLFLPNGPPSSSGDSSDESYVEWKGRVKRKEKEMRAAERLRDDLLMKEFIDDDDACPGVVKTRKHRNVGPKYLLFNAESDEDIAKVYQEDVNVDTDTVKIAKEDQEDIDVETDTVNITKEDREDIDVETDTVIPSEEEVDDMIDVFIQDGNDCHVTKRKGKNVNVNIAMGCHGGDCDGNINISKRSQDDGCDGDDGCIQSGDSDGSDCVLFFGRKKGKKKRNVDLFGEDSD